MDSDDRADAPSHVVTPSTSWPTGASRVVGVVGDPIAHSLSPQLHNAAFEAMGLDWASVAFPVRAGDADRAFEGMRALSIAGLSVTMPHKQAAFAAADELTDTARLLGAVNCLTLRDGTLVGDSTDGEGFVAALRRATRFDPAGHRSVVVGAGGAARAVILALAQAGADDVAVVNRTAANAEAAALLAGSCGRVGSPADVAGAELIVQATPVGMAGTAGGGATHPFTAIDAGQVHAGQIVADLVYHPLETPLMAAARARGAAVVGGLGMLVHQAALAIERWTGRSVPVEAMWATAERLVAGRAPGTRSS